MTNYWYCKQPKLTVKKRLFIQIYPTKHKGLMVAGSDGIKPEWAGFGRVQRVQRCTKPYVVPPSHEASPATGLK